MTYSEYRSQVQEIATKYFAAKMIAGNDLQVQDKYPYILKERKDWMKNIISDEVVKYIDDKKNEAKLKKEAFPLHKYLHHGLSSQAMLFNLFGEPLINNRYEFFQEIFQIPDITIDGKYELKFEHYDRDTFKENQQQPTSFDFAVYDKTKLHKNIFVEAKYVETEFGGCSCIKGGECDGLNPIKESASCILKQKGRNYWELMKNYKLDAPYYDSPICPFVIYYQFYRELLFALENNGYYVILIDRRNPAFEREYNGKPRGLLPILLERLMPEQQARLKVIYIQDVLPVLDKFKYENASEFRLKYGM